MESNKDNHCTIDIHKCCDQPNPLIWNGTSQRERLINALSPDFVKIDERSFEDILTFAYRYAACVKYYNEKDEPDGNWQCFFESDIGIFLAIISSEKPEAAERKYRRIEREFLEAREAFEDEDNREVTENPDPDYFKKLIDCIYELAAKIHTVCLSMSGHSIQTEIRSIIKDSIVKAILDNRIQSGLMRLIGYDKGNPHMTNDYSQFIMDAESDPCTKAWCLDQKCFD